jgi:hypothetical protein
MKSLPDMRSDLEMGIGYCEREFLEKIHKNNKNKALLEEIISLKQMLEILFYRFSAVEEVLLEKNLIKPKECWKAEKTHIKKRIDFFNQDFRDNTDLFSEVDENEKFRKDKEKDEG